jgi:23S rRNA pseudouridine2605 synthase
LTAEQLQAARAAHWRQQKNPILTLDDAAHWLEQHPLCLYLPRRAQLPAPAPSFVEAVLGTSAATPGTDAIAPAQALLTRLIDSGAVVALNLFGAVGEQPDFLVARQALPYVLCLRADADWKHAPEKSSGHKVSPLVLELWKALDKDGKDAGLTALEARELLGRELTEAAVLRGLGELWQALRIAPVFQEAGQPARWELLRVRHRDALATAGSTGQVTALSLLVSIYLQSVYAATSEEIEIFLSPLASRSRVREAVRGLSATRQIHSLSMDAQTYYFLEGGLPEFAVSAVSGPVEITLPAPPAIAFAAPRRPLPVAHDRKDQQFRPSATREGTRPPSRERTATRPPGREWKKPGERERPTAARPAFSPTRSFPAPAAGAGAKPNRGPQRNDGPPRGGTRPPFKGRETKPARQEVSREWRKPPLAGKPARPSYPARSFPPAASAQGAEGTTPRPQRSDAPVRSGARPDKRFGARAERPRGDRPAPWAQAGAKPPFRSSERPRPNRPADRLSGPPSAKRRSDGPVSGLPAGIAPQRGRPSGRPPASFRSKPGGSGPGRSGPRSGPRPGPGRSGPGSRPGTEPRRAGPGFGPGSRRHDGRPGGQTGAPRTSYPSSRPPRPSSPRDGESQTARPASSSRPAKPWQRTSSSPTRPGSRPGGKPAGKFGGKPGGGKPGSRPGGKPASQFGGKPGGKPGGRPGGKPGGRSPGDYPPRKPARKKPGA